MKSVRASTWSISGHPHISPPRPLDRDVASTSLGLGPSEEIQKCVGGRVVYLARRGRVRTYRRHQDEEINRVLLKYRFEYERAADFGREHASCARSILLQQRRIVHPSGRVDNPCDRPEACVDLIRDALHSHGIANISRDNKYLGTCLLDCANFSDPL